MKSTRKNATVMVCALLGMSLAGPGGRAAGDVRLVGSVEFHGLKSLGSREILSGVPHRVRGDGVVLDVDAMKDALGKNPYVRDFTMRKEGNKLVVEVQEREPAFILAIKKGRAVTAVEVDGSLRVLSVNHARGRDVPVVLVNGAGMSDGGLSKRLESVLGMLAEINLGKLAVYREIEEIDLTDYPHASILLRGRRTAFKVRARERDFMRLNYLAGFLDGAGWYPREAFDCGGFVVMK
jgi:hypothetical protein